MIKTIKEICKKKEEKKSEVDETNPKSQLMRI